jgi:nucleoside 2-deoxyribosyltransferase
LKRKEADSDETNCDNRAGIEEPILKIYIANPLGFSEAGRAFYATRVIPAIQSLGHEAIDPWVLTDQAKLDAVQAMPWGEMRRQAWRTLDLEIGHNNRVGIDRADAMFAILDGADVDSGTAAEIGYGFGRGLPILGYRGDFRICSDNEGAVINLQVEYFIRQSGGDIITRLADLPPALMKVQAKIG